MKRYITFLLLLVGVFSLQAQPPEPSVKLFATKDVVRFVSIPPQRGQVNVKYNYTAKAVSNDSNAVIRYYAEIRPGNMLPVITHKIDSVTGIFEWTPQVKGWYQITLVAKSNKGGVARQDFFVAVAGGNGIIQGKVTDTLNAGIPNVIIEVFKAEHNILLSFAYSTRTDENGNYRISQIDPGSYKLRATAPSTKYQSQWYDGKYTSSQANVISVSDSPAVTIANFKLRGGVSNAPKVTITGSVTDTTGIAINGAESRVVFVRADFAFNLGGGMNATIENFRKYFEFNFHGDFRLEGNSEFVFKAKVDSFGKYSVMLPLGRYIAFARAKGYATEFYFESSDLLSADVFVVDPTKLILQNPPNFTLAPLPAVVLGEIKGAVLDSVKNIGVPARVIAFRDGWRMNDNFRIARIYVTDADSTGSYVFDELLPGTYVVMALPLGRYAPAFYSDDTSNVRWKRATKIVVNGNSVDNINIYVRPFGVFANGYTGINGNVTVNGTSSGHIKGSLRAGAIVYATRNNEVVGYAITDASGNFVIDGLAPGMYSVFVDKAGYNESVTMNASAGYDMQGSPLNGTVNFTINAVTGVPSNVSVTPTEYVLNQNYPNPFNPSTTISYSLPKAGLVSLKIYNIVGQEVAALVTGYQDAGQYKVTFSGGNARNLATGIYFYRLESGSFNTVKKMILVK